MENDQTEEPGVSAPVAVGLVDDEIEQLRQRMLPRPPTAAEIAKATEDRRFWNGKADAPEIAAYQQRLATLEENNERLKAADRGPINFAAADDPRDLGHRALRAQISLLDSLIRDQVETLNRLAAAAATADWATTLAAETPVVRWLVERLEASDERHHAAELRIAELEALPGARAVRSTKPKALMSHMGAGMGDGLTPALTAPPSAAVPGGRPSAARRVSSAH